MEEPLKNQPSSSSTSVIAGKSKLRYPLRSASKVKDQTNKSPEIPNNSSSAASKRGRTSSMSKSVSVLELSAKDKQKTTKPPRRLSIPAKSSVSPRHKSATNITPISEAKSRRMANRQERCETPLSDVSKSSVRRKFNILSSASYWLSQIKLSESAAKHSISFGFFKLALEAGCEPLQRLREELKFYVQRHDLAELGDSIKSLFESYEIPETLEQVQESIICSQVSEDATALSSDDVQSTSSIAATKMPKLKSLNALTVASAAKASSKKENVQRITPVTKSRASFSREPIKPKLITESGGNNIKKKVQNPAKQTPNNVDKINKQDQKTVSEEVTAKQVDIEEPLEGNKENMDAPLMAEVM
ncbi:uncharacterized protein LOC130800370 [Amaranthus tricolor]|uniref:uncharacterized protein LOC130800370 n=1 Tax=Amaranthus tricolor TaxID=29722 RepID=UPI00258B2804|nr:uncharacterized protein LOC130800370 [Amaranthus tricolor]